jgi:hypothetical protein
MSLMNIQRIKNIVFIMVFLLDVFPLFARDVEIKIIDTDLNLPLEGAIIRSWDGTEYICDEDGKALITVPDDMQVVIYAFYPGYENARLIVITDVYSYTLNLRLLNIIENKELVIEASRPKNSGSIAISGREIAQTAEIGAIEDVMSTIKLLPGVGYTSFMNAQPSIRGGDPGDMGALLDGFFIFYPFYQGGYSSIFDPRMVQSAQLSNGVFSSRYGHTISGLLDITSKKPSPDNTELELGISTSAVNSNLSFPFGGKSSVNRGGLLFMVRISYYDPIIALAKLMAKSIEPLEVVNTIQTAPYIRSGTLTGNYRFLDNLELSATGFFGMDGMGVNYISPSREVQFDMNNYQFFLTSGLSWNPRNDMLLKISAGTGYQSFSVDVNTQTNIFDKDFPQSPANTWYHEMLRSRFKSPYDFCTELITKQTNSTLNVQSRIDYDWDLENGFLFALGIQEMFASFDSNGKYQLYIDKKLSEFEYGVQNDILDRITTDDLILRDFLREHLYINFPSKYSANAENKLFTTSGYGLIEYNTPNQWFIAELGLRIDHYYLLGENLELLSKPILNPRLNMNFNVLKDLGFVQSLDLSAGTGLFSSMNNLLSMNNFSTSNLFSSTNNHFFGMEAINIDEYRPMRSWTSVLGIRTELIDSYYINIEGYYKHLYDRMYFPIDNSFDMTDLQTKFNGKGNVWGIDLLLQKKLSRFWDGWISYSFNWTKYNDPGTNENNWYFPEYHRFHNLNLVLNLKPTSRINIFTRFGIVSGVQILELSGESPESYPVYVYDSDNPANDQFIEKYFWTSILDQNKRTTPSIQMDVKISIFGRNNSRKTRFELYVAVENILGLLFPSQGNPGFDPYTGEVDTSIMSISYDMPIPIPSFGIKYSY